MTFTRIFSFTFRTFICGTFAAVFSQSLVFASPQKDYQLCSRVFFREAIPFQFLDDEKRLLCGDKDSSATAKDWADIPASQAQMYLTAMLQTRGYHEPDFENREGILFVKLGEPTLIQKIKVQGAPIELDIDRKREVKGRKLTPAKLDELQDWVGFELKHIGYPCPQQNVVADYSNGEVIVQVRPGYRSKILEVNSDELGDLHDGVVRRYDAFHVGEEFDIWDVILSERRASEDDLIVGSHFNRDCSPEGVKLYQKIQPGLPRLFRAGVGLDTEQGPSIRITSHYSRMNQRGSSVDVSLLTSYRLQEFISTFNWYFLKKPSRFYFKPSIEARRMLESQYEYNEYRASFLPSLSWDDNFNRWDASLGLSYQDDHTVSGVGPGDSHNIFLNENIVVKSHGYEYFVTNPQSGYKFILSSLTSNSAIASSVTASKINLSGEALWNIRNYAPPTVILGLRGLLGTTITPNGSADAPNLPPPLRSVLGGADDLRGFVRKELPRNNPNGALSEAYLGSEARFPSLLSWGLQPYLFLEAGALGNEPHHLVWPLYWDPGLGLRWASPVGTFRGEVAHGFIDGPDVALNSDWSHWQFYISYGAEF